MIPKDHTSKTNFQDKNDSCKNPFTFIAISINYFFDDYVMYFIT